MKKVWILWSLLLIVQLACHAQNYRKHLVFHLKPTGDMLTDTVSGRQWGPFSNTQLLPDRFGQLQAMFFKGGNGAANKVILENLKIKNLSKKGYTLVFWSGFQRADSANYSHAFISKYIFPPNVNEQCGANIGIVRFRTYYYYNTRSQCDFVLRDSVVQKQRLKPNRWIYQFISFDSLSTRIGINDTVWQADSAKLKSMNDNCPLPLRGPYNRLDSINHIRLNVPFPLYVLPTFPCPEPPDNLVDKFTFYDDVMIFDTAYGLADFEKLRYFPDTATNIVSLKPFFSESYRYVYKYEKDQDRLVLIDEIFQNQIAQIQIVNFMGQVMYQNSAVVQEIAVRNFPSAVYLVRLRLKDGDVVVQKILKN